jgi:propanol-preferring alcohol dehydrogenase
MMGGWEDSYQVLQYIRDKRIEPIVTKVALRKLPEAIGKMCQDTFVGKLVVVMEDSVTQPQLRWFAVSY